jgi:hypothetical protein
LDRYDIEERMQQLTTSIGTRLGSVDKRLDDLKKLQISNNRQIHRKPQPDLSGAQKVARHAVLKFLNYETAEDGFRERYASKAAVAAGSVAVPGWAAELTAGDTADFLLGGSAPSLLARLLRAGLDTGSGWPLKIGFRSGGEPMGGWVVEANPAPVGALQLATFTPVTRKLMGMAIISKQLKKYSSPAIEAIISAFLQRDLNAVIDGALLDDQPSSQSRPQGLLNGVTATPPGADLAADLKLLAAAILDAGGTAPLFILSPVTAIEIGLMTGTFAHPIFDTPLCPAGRIIALDALSFAGSLGTLEISSSEEATVHMDSTPQAIVDGAGVAASAVSSLWQTARVGISGLVDAGWGIAPGHVAYIDQE